MNTSQTSPTPPPSETSPRFRRARRRAPLALLARLVASVLLGVAATVLLPQPAVAASPGLGWFGPSGSNGLGRWTVGSTIVYCVDPLYGSEGGSNGSSYTLGPGDWLNHYGPPHHLSERDIARINWAIRSYGMIDGAGANARRWAAAVQLYVWSITAPDVYANPGAYAPGGGAGDGDSWFTARILMHGGTSGDRAAVLDRLDRLRDEDDDVDGEVPDVGGRISVDDAGDEDPASLVITRAGVPAGVRYTVTLTNARFADGDATESFTGNGSSRITAHPPTGGEESGYTITAKISYTRSYWSTRLKLWKPSGGQRVAAGTQLSRSYSATGSLEVGPVAHEVFAPVVSTSAPRFVLPGEAFDDDVVFDVVEHDGRRNEWAYDPSTGYTAITAAGSLYGPFAEQPLMTDQAPSDAPRVAAVTITTDAAEGPGAYSVQRHGVLAEGSLTAVEAGFYSWVWEVNALDQSSEARERLPEAYSFLDAFGRSAETSVVPMTVEAVTRATAPEAALSAPLQDVLTVTNDGLWLQDEGEPIPVTFRGTAFYVPGAVAPAQSGEIPLAAEAIGSTLLTVTGPGAYPSDPGGILAPDDVTDGGGFVVWRWEILPEDQPEEYRGWVGDWADQFGVAAETQRLLVPEVTTRAQETAAVGAPFTDVATVTGVLPDGGALLSFELYDAALGESADPIWASEPALVTAPGDYESPAAPGQLPGSYYWVELLTSVVDVDGDGEREIARGRWGLPEEMTKVVPPGATTGASPGAPLGAGVEALSPDSSTAAPEGVLFDTATITGPIPAGGAELRFAAYLVPMASSPSAPDAPLEIDYPDGVERGDLTWACTDDTLAYASTEPVRVTAPGDYRSAAFAPQAHGLYLWVETLSVDLGHGPVVIHRGACGVAEEASAVVDVTTEASSDDPSGIDPAPTLHDTARLVGYVPEGASLVFEAYRGPSAADPLCTADTLVHRSGPIELTDGLYPPGRPLEVAADAYQAPELTASATRVYWVQSLYDGLGRLVSRGECGDPAETTLVPAPRLAATGAEAAPLARAAAAFAIGGLALLVIALRRRPG